MQSPNDSINYSTEQIAYRSYPEAGSYPILFIVTDSNYCTDTVLTYLVIDPTPEVHFDFEEPCIGEIVSFTDQSITPEFSTYFWDLGNNSFSILTNPSTSYFAPGDCFVSLTITSPIGCAGSEIVLLTSHSIPLVEMDLGPYCKGTYTQASDISSVLGGTIDSSYWIFNQIDTLVGPQVEYVFSSLGQQEVILHSISNFGCENSINKFIDVNSELNADFSVGSGLIAAGAPFNCINSSIGAALCLWNFGDNTFSNAYSPEHIYGEAFIDSSMQIYLIALNEEGCIDTAFHTISVERAKIDLELSYLFIEKQNDWHTIGVKLTNRGTAPLKKMELNLETEKGFLFQETLVFELKPLEDTIYMFNAHPISSSSDQNSEETFVCVNALGYDLYLKEETLLWNNYLCKNVEGENVILKPIHPNPVEGDLMVELIVTKDSEVTLQLFDAFGRAARTILPKQILTEGQYSYKVSTDQLSSGTYFIRMVSIDNIVMEKIILH
jgi:hypothetical protein